MAALSSVCAEEIRQKRQKIRRMEKWLEAIKKVRQK
jgi:hypothetical protein